MKTRVYLLLILLPGLFITNCSSELPTESIDPSNPQQDASSIFHISRSTNVDDAEALISGSFLTWWEATMSDTPSMGLGVASDTYTCGWSNWGMSALSVEPRVAFDNSKAAPRIDLVEVPWFGNYSAIFAASDGIREIESGAVDLGPNNERAIAFGKLVQGLAHGYLAIFFDQGFVLDEDTDLVTSVLNLVPYTEVMAAAMDNLEQAISIFNANSFTIPSNWINGRTYTSAELAQLAHSFIARYLVAMARDRTERQSLDWNEVLAHLDQGLTFDFQVSGIGTGRNELWWSATHWYSADHNNWSRLDYKLIGPADRSSAYNDWLALAPADRDEYIGDFGDLRIWDQTLDDDGNQNPGLYMEQTGSSAYPGGGYQRSRYGQHQFDEYRFETSAGSAIPVFRLSEHDFMRAEALLHLGGNSAEIAALLDKTHVTNGGYPSAAGLPVGDINNTPNPIHENGATLWSVLKYEKKIELLGTWSGLQFWDNRGWGDLTPLTPIHFPVPARELQFLLLPNYSFGGGGPGSAE